MSTYLDESIRRQRFRWWLHVVMFGVYTLITLVLIGFSRYPATVPAIMAALAIFVFAYLTGNEVRLMVNEFIRGRVRREIEAGTLTETYREKQKRTPPSPSRLASDEFYAAENVEALYDEYAASKR